MADQPHVRYEALRDFMTGDDFNLCYGEGCTEPDFVLVHKGDKVIGGDIDHQTTPPYIYLDVPGYGWIGCVPMTAVRRVPAWEV